MTTWAILAYLLLEIDVPTKFKNAGHQDSKVGEYLARYYKHTREEEIEPMYRRLAIWAIYAWYSGAIFFYVTFFQFNLLPSNESGKMDGLWTSGFTAFTVLILVHHLIICAGTRHYSWYIAFAYFFSILCFCPVTVLLNEKIPSTQMYHTTFSDIFTSPIYWMIVSVCSIAIVFPYYFFRKYFEVVKFPEFYTQDFQIDES